MFLLDQKNGYGSKRKRERMSKIFENKEEGGAGKQRKRAIGDKYGE